MKKERTKGFKLRNRQIKQHEYVSLFKLPNFAAANIRCFTECILIAYIENNMDTDQTVP